MNVLNIISTVFILCSYSVHSFTLNDDSIYNEQGFVKNSNDLSIKLLNVLPKYQNSFYSPLSITYSLYVLLNGADGQTEADLKNLLNIGPNDTLQSINSDIKTTLNSLRDKNIDEVVVRFANRILLSNAYNLSENFQNSIKDEFNSSVDSVGFLENLPNITTEINDWIKEQTNEKIPKLLESLSSDSALVIANALHLSSKWDQPFDHWSTKENKFYGLKGETTVQMMRIEERFRYSQIRDLKTSLIELPFIDGSNLSMIIYLPNERNGLNQLIQDLGSELLDDSLILLQSSLKYRLSLSLPRFNLETDYDLKPTLNKLGLSSLFTNKTNLSRMTGANNLKVSQVINKAVIKVKESGVGTDDGIVNVVKRSWINTKPIPVVVDVPFLFLIQDTQSGLILFIGQVWDLP